MRRLAAFSLLLCAQLACADYWAVIGSFSSLSDLFVVYTTNAGLSGDGDSEYLRQDYSRMFANTWEETLGEQLVVKLRYRLGS